jgi:chloramphenicol-sensitive protein RarD
VNPTSSSSGALLALGAFGLWGLTPIYWKAVRFVPPDALLAYRVLWALAVGVLLLGVTRNFGRWREALSQPRTVAAMGLAAALLAVNWLIFIWAVNNDRVLATALGYYINPLVSVALGALVLGERLRRGQTIAVAIAAVGVACMTIASGELPWIAVTLASSFGLYGLVRKLTPTEPVVGFAVEMTLIAPFAVFYLTAIAPEGESAPIFESPGVAALVSLAGVVTAAPLLLFNGAAKRLRLASLGFFQYLAPSLTFLLAVLVYGEPFTASHGITFACVWSALALYSVDSIRAMRDEAPADGAASNANVESA